MSLIFSSCKYVNTIILYKSLDAFSSDDGKIVIDWNQIAILLSTLVVSKIFLSIFDTQLGFQLGILGMKIKNCLCSMILTKALKKSILREKEFTVGQMINLTSADAQKFSSIGQQGISLITFPILVVQGLAILIYVMGNAVWPSLGLTFIILFINFNLGGSFVSINRAIMLIKDKRLKVVNECFSNVRFVKLSATENYFLARMCDIKEEELKLQRKVFTRITWLSFMNRLSPAIFLCSLIGFYSYFYDGKNISVQIIFTGFSAYSTFASTMGSFPYTLSFFFDVLVSGKRINDFLISEEVNNEYINWNRGNSLENGYLDAENAIEIRKF